MAHHVRICFLHVSVVLAVLLNGCVTTKEISVDYPIPSEAIHAINGSHGEAQIVLASGETAAVYELTVDSLMARWKVGEWRGVPVADLMSVTVRDETETASRVLTGILYSAAAFGAIALIDGLSQDRAGVAGEVLLSAGVGGALALATSSVWAPMTEARIRYSIRPPRLAEDTVGRAADRSRSEAMVQAMITDLNIRSRNFRIEPTFLYGRGNSVSPEVDATSPRVMGGGITFGLRCWENLELGIQFLVASHSFKKMTPDESVRRFFFALNANYFPFEQSGIFLKGGIGYGVYSATGTYSGPMHTKFAVSPTTVTGDGPIFNMSAGYDIRLADAWSIRPHVQYTIMPIGKLKLDDGTVIAAGKTSTLLSLCVSLVYKGVI